MTDNFTTLQAAQERIKELEAQLDMMQRVINALPMRVFWKDTDMVYQGSNLKFARDGGLNRVSDLVGKTDYDLVWAETDAEDFRRDDKQVMDSGESKINFVETQMRPDETHQYVRTSKIPLQDDNGEIIGVAGTYEDITEQMSVEEALRQSEEQQRTLIENMQDGVIIVDEGHIVYSNEAFAQMMGYARDEVIGLGIPDVIAPEDLQFMVTEYQSQVSGEETNKQLAFHLLHKDGETRVPVMMSTASVLYEGKTSNMGTIKNMAPFREAEAERARMREEVIAAQRSALEELSTPIIPILDDVIVMPLVGSLDSNRARDVTRALLSSISEYRAKTVILDITGVAVVDSGVASHLNRTIQAARLKGATTIITGVSDAVAETIVDLGIDWSMLETVSSLQAGLQLALRRMGLRITAFQKKTNDPAKS